MRRLKYAVNHFSAASSLITAAFFLVATTPRPGPGSLGFPGAGTRGEGWEEAQGAARRKPARS